MNFHFIYITGRGFQYITTCSARVSNAGFVSYFIENIIYYGGANTCTYLCECEWMLEDKQSMCVGNTVDLWVL